jgi:hypothetical protein
MALIAPDGQDQRAFAATTNEAANALFDAHDASEMLKKNLQGGRFRRF